MGSLPLTAGPAFPDEAPFLESLQGEWTGRGTVRLRLDRSPMTVSCNIASSASGPSLTMRGTCRALVLVSRTIAADLRAAGERYSGVYIGPQGGRSALSGQRRGNTINLAVRWAKIVNGDHSANMQIRKVGSNRITLATIDTDLATGKSVVTSEINLRRR
ncbi:hypothetical protein PYH37_000952 [Sinorhizobium numidicum]|uniref:DUF1579 domain-containing protein n=1 Tax=Sinorhizobium numidicum TaxID=680248 RepID=A0ABY8CXV6_9HYPH|nr:hypothetical protein [Sinorhizobium numidicum]WEX75793.1 hypothetical protein PYH37_000952 [Sinorhizobium numidicum]WEX81776.1 hypothetical protein PYH38_000953 [Sinorhizobium numidicum]